MMGYNITLASQLSKGTIMTDKDQAFEEIKKHREQIDLLDQKIVALLNERAGHSLDIRALKPDARMGLYDPKREEEIFARVASYNEGPLYNENLREIYQTILKVSKEVPNRD
jgi:chorismate mutase